MNVNQAAPDELGIKHIQYFNQWKEGPYNINREWYIASTLEIISKIEKSKKDIAYINSIKSPNQLSLL